MIKGGQKSAAHAKIDARAIHAKKTPFKHRIAVYFAAVGTGFGAMRVVLRHVRLPAAAFAAVVGAGAGAGSAAGGDPPRRPAALAGVAVDALAPLAVVGGHDGVLTDGKYILKPCNGARGAAELAFYRRVFAGAGAGAGAAASLPPPARFMPAFFGAVTRLADGRWVDADDAEAGGASAVGSVRYLVLEDATAGYAAPCVLDLKMGVQTWGEDAPAAKIAAERAKWPLMETVGFRFTGMRVWRPAGAGAGGGGSGAGGAGGGGGASSAAAAAGSWVAHGRAYGYALDEETIPRAFAEFLGGGGAGGGRIRAGALPPLLARVREVEAWFAAQNAFRFYGSSLLFVYEGGGAEDGDGEGAGGDAGAGAGAAPSRRPRRADVRMIDFAHVWPITDGPAGRDDGYATGLRNVRAYLEAVGRAAVAAEEERAEAARAG